MSGDGGPRAACTGAILVGGRSRRMGRPKHAIAMGDGRPMIEHVAAAMLQVCRGAIVTVGGDAPSLPGSPHIADLRPGLGPLGGIEALLASGLDEWYLVCPCDLPRITAELLRALATVGDGHAAALVRIEGEPHPRALPAAIADRALPAVREALDNRRLKLRDVLLSLDPEVTDMPPAAASVLHNVNTPQTLRALDES